MAAVGRLNWGLLPTQSKNSSSPAFSCSSSQRFREQVQVIPEIRSLTVCQRNQVNPAFVFPLSWFFGTKQAFPIGIGTPPWQNLPKHFLASVFNRGSKFSNHQRMHHVKVVKTRFELQTLVVNFEEKSSTPIF